MKKISKVSLRATGILAAIVLPLSQVNAGPAILNGAIHPAGVVASPNDESLYIAGANTAGFSYVAQESGNKLSKYDANTGFLINANLPPCPIITLPLAIFAICFSYLRLADRASKTRKGARA
jgi:hypothetical protein